MRVIGLDVATRTGFAVYDGRVWTTGALRCPIKRPKGKGLNAAHVGAVIDWLTGELHTVFLSAAPLDAAAIETPIIGGGVKLDPRAVHMLNAMAGAAARVAHRARVPVVYVGNQTWRKAFGVTGKGTAAKKADAMRICRFEGIPVSSDDEADAVGIARWLYSERAGARFSRHEDTPLFDGRA